MKPPLSDTLVICDMDNTLLTAKEGIPACNRAVIRLYTGMGGLFTVATGRPPESIRAALGNLKLSLPVISCNGALLYDFSTESVLHRSTLNREQATTAIIDILAKFPRMGVEVMAGNGEMYVIHANEVTHAHQVDEHLGSIACPVENVPDGWVKVVFASDPESIRKLGTDDGTALLINIHICSDESRRQVLFPMSEQELPEQRYARLLYRMSSTMPDIYGESIVRLRGGGDGPFRGMSYNAGMTELVSMMDIGSVSVNLLF